MQRPRNMHAKAGESDRAIRVKMVSLPALSFDIHLRIVYSQNIGSQGNGKEGKQTGGNRLAIMFSALYPLRLYCTICIMFLCTNLYFGIHM